MPTPITISKGTEIMYCMGFDMKTVSRTVTLKNMEGCKKSKQGT